MSLPDISLDELEQISSVNLDEATTEYVTVRFREREPDPNRPGALRSRWRTVEIERFCPTSVYHYMMATKDRADRMEALRQRALEQDGEVSETSPRFTWMMECVWRVWKETEPDMTLERLRSGVDGQFISRLFLLFFTDRKRRPTAKVTTDDASTLATEPTTPQA